MKKYTLINKYTNLPIKISTTFINEWDVSEIFFFTEFNNGFYFLLDTIEEIQNAAEIYHSYIYNSPKKPFWDNLNPNDYTIKEIELIY